ncbi:Mercuric resistance operon regulatory protein [Gimesia panareensis]|uniref:Mercuric resistance operon regulatory protein n=1 Tax=Gimesia panareensis TaxID=2527978 RepID=A0A517Q1F1_9PLAN|nr:MerR family transcriptional regulator [Gimesia panareensis]QDT25460.1 Mercuric resistance operon regulatory protein [Gimesia panareensis]
MLFSIGEFSKITGLSIKTLRFYHEQAVLIPSHIDEKTGYRYYAESKIERAHIITSLRRLNFTLSDISDILSNFDDEADLLDYLEQQKQRISEKLKEYRVISDSLNQIILREKEARKVMKQATFEVEEKTVDSVLIAGIRMQGKYSDCGKGFGQLGRQLGSHICGKPFLLHYDTEYKELDADFEACMPIRKEISEEGISVRELEGGRCVALIHKGPYEELGRSYARILSYIKQKGLEIKMPTREVYIKGPGMIFKGNPRNYLTEIQMLIRE